ncbi:MAG: PD-(D/E)XK nuclease family protein [Treponema sp.]|nr:PD-(D/E)XK nuclease family protein [Treponema sp.]
MTGVFETILKALNEKDTCFVFPSETTAVLWARKICLYGNVRSLAQDRFLAWDRFKEETIRAKEKNRKPVSSLIRRLFAQVLARQNAAVPFLRVIIPAAYAQSGAVFADSIATSLSSLGRWEELQEAAGRRDFRDDDEDRDWRSIKKKYAAFLEDHDLFEPSWEKASFRENGKRFIIFFPKTLEDFSEYAPSLNSPAVTLYPDEEHEQAEIPILQLYNSARQEIRSAILELRRLHEAGHPYEEMALTLPDYKKTAPYVERELFLHDIPFNRRAGKSLGEYPLGRLFSLIGECTAALFSFDAVKLLLLDSAIPWKDPEKNGALIDYGIKNHCAAPFRDHSRTVDAWEEGFRQNPNEELAVYYGELKRNLCALTGASSFRGIREQYHVFRSFLAMEKCSAESNAVLARCIEELSVLIETEEAFPGLTAADPFDFFVSHLKEKKYVYARNDGGVNLYDYPVAAGAPFDCHFLLNVSQAAAAVQHRPLPFLRQDKRAMLGITDTDASAAILSLYSIASWNEYACHTWISASEKTFSGWAIPHSVFAQNFIGIEKSAQSLQGTADLFAAERYWRAYNSLPEQNCCEKPKRLYSIQREGFRRWSAVLLDETSAGEAEAPANGTSIADVSALLRERIHSKNLDRADNPAAIVPDLSISSTDLNEFFTCPMLWLYRRIFRMEKHEKDAALLDDQSRGLIYHEILHHLFYRIKKNGRRFFKKNLSLYFEWIEEISGSVLRDSDALRGPLVYPLGSSINKRLRSLLKIEAEYFDGLEIKDLERRYDVSRGRILLTGRIDRISQGPMIIDYKTNAPLQSHCRWEKKEGLRDFQIPMYIKLYETAEGVPVSRAFFFNINRNEVVPVVGKFRGKEFSREEYQSTMEALEKAIEHFDFSISSLDFTPGKNPYKFFITKTCTSCEFKTICRSLYSLNPRPDFRDAKIPDEEEEDGF